MANKFDYNAHKDKMRAIIANAAVVKGQVPGATDARQKILQKLLGGKGMNERS